MDHNRYGASVPQFASGEPLRRPQLDSVAWKAQQAQIEQLKEMAKRMRDADERYSGQKDADHVRVA
jgi:hypothetical protein